MSHRRDIDTRFRPAGVEPLARSPVSVKLPHHVDAIVRGLPDSSGWLRQVICEAVEKLSAP